TKKVCRVCQNSTGVMVNIFDGAGNQDAGISVADMISQCTGFPVAKDDPYPDTICLTCLMDTQNAFKMKENYKRSRQAFASDNGLNNEINMDLLDVRRDLDEALVRSDTDSLDAQDPGPSNCLQRFNCTYCSQSFSRQSHLRDHTLRHTGDRPFQCSFCPQAFVKRCNLKAHVRTHTGERPFKCSECSKAFAKKSYLRHHIFTHTGERPYQCLSCLKTFSHGSALREHTKTHIQDRPYKCSQCPKSFERMKTLEVHSRIHSDERSHSCTICQKFFKKKFDLTTHMRTHTGERPFKCSHCSKSFTQ
ncbi:hypothetical protein KR067_001427, partial [Drosophila pandora]